MHHREAFQKFRQSGLPIDQFAIETSRLNNRLCVIVASVIGNASKGRIMFEHQDIAMSDAHAMIKRISATTDAITAKQSLHLVVDNADHSAHLIDPEMWGLGHPDSESLRQIAR